MNKKVTEYFFTLALNAETGYYRVNGNYLTYGIVGAILMDLTLDGRIELNGKNIKVLNRDITGVDAYDRMLGELSSSGKERSIRYWLRKFVFRATWYRKELQKVFTVNGILKHERKRFLGIPYSLYYPASSSETAKLIYRLKDIVLHHKTPDEHELMFLGLAYACRMHRSIAKESHQRQAFRKALVKYIKENPVASGVSNTIAEMQAAITVAVTAAVIASSASSSSSH